MRKKVYSLSVPVIEDYLRYAKRGCDGIQPGEDGPGRMSP
jgi:hypothetical protein